MKTDRLMELAGIIPEESKDYMVIVFNRYDAHKSKIIQERGDPQEIANKLGFGGEQLNRGNDFFGVDADEFSLLIIPK